MPLLARHVQRGAPTIAGGVPVSAQVADEEGGGFGLAMEARVDEGSAAGLGIAVIDGEAKLAH